MILPLLRAAAAVLALLAAPAGALDITLPGDSSALQPSDLPGYALAQAKCLTCHSTEYVQYQPATLGRTYWKATVAKMKKPFGAALDDADIDAITDYLVRTYGNERSTR
jgi:mono/diheme cytochrome c family protein